MTIVITVGGSVLYEFYNVNTVSMNISMLSNTAANQSALLFSQESYKQAAENNSSSNVNHVTNTDNEVYVSGKFYEGNTSEEIYAKLYTSESFKNWLSSDVIRTKGNWKNIKLIDKALNTPGFLNKELGQDGYEDARQARMFKETMMTPSNLGIPYLDRDILTKMFRWNLAEIFSNGQPEMIRKDEAGVDYVFYNGFRVYAQMAAISELEYEVFDLSTSSGKSEFSTVTNIDPTKLGLGGATDERNRIAVVGIKYQIPIAYEGVTPIKQVFKFVWETEVDGLDGNSSRSGTIREWKDNTETFESGGLRGNQLIEGVLPVPGKLIYYIIR